MIIQDFVEQRVIGLADRNVGPLLANQAVDRLPPNVRGTLMHLAAKEGHIKLASEYLITELRLDVNQKDNNKRTPAMYAAANGEAGMVELLFDNGADIRLKDSRGMNILHYAVQSASMSTVKYLCFELPAEDAAWLVNQRSDDHKTPLHLAAEGESHGGELVSDLLQIRGIDVNIEDSEGKTALMYAAIIGSTAVVKALCRYHLTRISGTDMKGWNILHHAIMGSSLETFQFFSRDRSSEVCSMVSDGDNTGIQPLHLAAFSGNTEIVSLLLEFEGIDVNVEDGEGVTGMMYAAQAGQTGVLALLIERTDTIVNKIDHDGRTVAHHAAMGGFPETVRYLCTVDRLEMDSQDNDGNTALLLAMTNKKFEAALQFVEVVDCSKTNLSEETPLSLAFKENHKHLLWEIVNQLSVDDVDVNLSNENQETLLHMGIYENDEEFVRKICENPNIQNSRNINGVTPIELAIDKEFYSMLWILVKNLPQDQLDVNKSYKGGNTLLHIAVKQHNLDVAKYICTLPDVRCKENDNGFDPFQLAIRDELNIPLPFLIHLYKLPGTKVMFKDNINRRYRGKGLIHIAAELGGKEECKRLLEEFPNIDVNARDSENRTALHIATANCHIDTIMTLSLQSTK